MSWQHSTDLIGEGFGSDFWRRDARLLHQQELLSDQASCSERRDV